MKHYTTCIVYEEWLIWQLKFTVILKSCFFEYRVYLTISIYIFCFDSKVLFPSLTFLNISENVFWSIKKKLSYRSKKPFKQIHPVSLFLALCTWEREWVRFGSPEGRGLPLMTVSHALEFILRWLMNVS